MQRSFCSLSSDLVVWTDPYSSSYRTGTTGHIVNIYQSPHLPLHLQISTPRPSTPRQAYEITAPQIPQIYSSSLSTNSSGDFGPESAGSSPRAPYFGNGGSGSQLGSPDSFMSNSSFRGAPAPVDTYPMQGYGRSGYIGAVGSDYLEAQYVNWS